MYAPNLPGSTPGTQQNPNTNPRGGFSPLAAANNTQNMPGTQVQLNPMPQTAAAMVQPPQQPQADVNNPGAGMGNNPHMVYPQVSGYPTHVYTNPINNNNPYTTGGGYNNVQQNQPGSSVTLPQNLLDSTQNSNMSYPPQNPTNTGYQQGIYQGYTPQMMTNPNNNQPGYLHQMGAPNTSYPQDPNYLQQQQQQPGFPLNQQQIPGHPQHQQQIPGYPQQQQQMPGYSQHQQQQIPGHPQHQQQIPGYPQHQQQQQMPGYPQHQQQQQIPGFPQHQPGSGYPPGYPPGYQPGYPNMQPNPMGTGGFPPPNNPYMNPQGQGMYWNQGQPQFNPYAYNAPPPNNQNDEVRRLKEELEALNRKREEEERRKEDQDRLRRIEQLLINNDKPNYGPETIKKIEEIKKKERKVAGNPSASSTHVDEQKRKIEQLKLELKVKQAELATTSKITSSTNDTVALQRQLDEQKRILKILEDNNSSNVDALVIKTKELEVKLKGIDLAILMDCTGSMSAWIETSKNKVIEITNRITSTYPKLTLRMAFVAYRDFGDKKQIEVKDFTTDGDAMKSFISSLEATGGNDGPEDIAGGLEALKSLSWNSRARLIIHFCDAPPHGKKYHSIPDDYPEGDPLKRVPEDILYDLQSKGIDYYLARLDKKIEQMFEIFKKRCAGLPNMNFKLLDAISASVDQFVPLVESSISITVSSSGMRSAPPKTKF